MKEAVAIFAFAAILWLLGGCKDKVEIRPGLPVGPYSTPDPTPSPTPKKSTVSTGESRYAFQEERWRKAEIRSINAVALDKSASLFERNRSRYEAIEKSSQVPAGVIFVLHGRESTWDFRTHLHNGDPLTKRTTHVPAGRPKSGSPPFSFEFSAADALEYDGLPGKNWRSLGDGLQAMEAFNGLGVQKYHSEFPTGYLWAGSSVYLGGKYVRDGVYDKTAWDKQLGAATILKWMQYRNIEVWPAITIRTDFTGKVTAIFWIRGRMEF